ncbi:MAG: hypothetical protein CMK64_02510 [Pseudoalteromonas sp.]|nr:hypothetical protein [Pseudoalteromonas sp.]
MLVKDIYKWTKLYSQLPACDELFEFSNSWHFDDAKSTYPPFRGSPGVYIYAKGKTQAEFDNCDLEVLYIGMSEVDVCGRIWSHVGTIYDPETKQEWLPKFKKHQWESSSYVSGDIKNTVANGNMTVFCIRPNSDNLPNLPRALEAALISSYYLVNKCLPPLNLQF